MKIKQNKFVKIEHIFIEGEGTFYPSLEIAKKEYYNPNGVGFWVETVIHDGKEWFQCGYTNVYN